MTKRLTGRTATATALTVLVAVLAVLGGGQVRAATIVVTTLADENGTNPAACSLREAIAAAGSDSPVGGCPAGAGADTITFAVSGTVTLTPALGPLNVSGGVLTIQGPGAGGIIVDGGAAVQLLQVAAGAQLTLAGLTLANGRSAGEGGAILNSGTLTIISSSFSNNTAARWGGAIWNARTASATLTVTDSSFSDNQAGFGGAIFNDSVLSITGSTFTTNEAALDGGALYHRVDIATSTFTISSSTFSGNVARNGGAIGNEFNQPSRAAVAGSTFNDNVAGSLGGAIYNLIFSVSQGTLSVTNSTLYRNRARVGAAILSSGNPRTDITNSTLAGNQSGTGGAIVLFPAAAVSLHNVVLTNPSPSCGAGGTVTDLGGNVAADGSCPFTQSSSRINTDPLLGPLQNNGGPTQTMALLPGSPAIDAGVDCPPPDTDQRGVSRPQGAACDSGAYELAQPAGTLTGAKTCTRTSATTADCTLAFTINPPTTGTNALTITTDTGSFGEVSAAGSPAACIPGAVSAAGPATVSLTLPAGCSGVTLSETLRDLPIGMTAVTQTATLAGPDSATGAFTATLGAAPPPAPDVLGFRQAAGLRFTCPPLAGVRQVITCTVVPVDAAGNTVATAPGVIEVSSLAGGLVTASNTRSTNLRIPCGGRAPAPSSQGMPIDPNTCRGVTFQLASTGVGQVEIRARYEPDSAPAAAGIDELETDTTVTFVAG